MTHNYHARTCCEEDHATGAIFVFGSNEAGIHGAGAARHAVSHHGAYPWVGEGMQGRAYGIPTKDVDIESLPLSVVMQNVSTFLHLTWAQPWRRFFVTRIGCGLAGFTDAQIAPLFAAAPPNCLLPPEWRDILEEGTVEEDPSTPSLHDF